MCACYLGHCIIINHKHIYQYISDKSKSIRGELNVEEEGGEIFHYKILPSYHSSKDAMLVHSHFPQALTHATWVVRQRDTFLECPAREFVA